MRGEASPIEWHDVPADEVLRIKRKGGEYIRFSKKPNCCLSKLERFISA